MRPPGGPGRRARTGAIPKVRRVASPANSGSSAEERNIGYLFKLKQSANVKKLIGQIFDKEEWVEAGQQWKGRVDELRLNGWTKARRVIVLRRPLPNKPASEAEASGKKKSRGKAAKQLSLDLPEIDYRGVPYEYVVLVTSLTDEVLTVAQHYRDLRRSPKMTHRYSPKVT